MKRVDLPHLYWRTRKRGGKTYGPYPYVRVGKREHRIHAEPGTPEFTAEYWSIRSGRTAKPGRTSWSKLIESYRASPKYQRLAPGTRRNYDRHLMAILEKNAARDVREFRRRHAIEARDKLAANWSKANERVSVLSILLRHAVDLEWIERNPVTDIEKLKGGSYDAWPEAKLAAFERYCDAQGETVARTIYELARGTGQRLGDCLKMRWSDFDGGFVRVIQQKTGADLWVYCPARLQAYLAALPRSGEHVMARTLRTPMTASTVQKAVERVRDAIGARAYVIHGWRYNAAQELADAGCSEADIMAVTGHKTAAMARKYAAGADQKRRSKAAQDRRE